MDRPSSKVLARRADRVRPGVIVSTVSEAAYDQTVVFIEDASERVGFRMVVQYSPFGQGFTAHEVAIAKVRHPSNPLRVPENRYVFRNSSDGELRMVTA